MNHLATLSYKFCCLRALSACWALFWGICFIGIDAQAQIDNSNADTAKESPQPPSADTTARPMIDRDKQALTLLSGEVDTNDIRWLNARGEKFLALWQPDRTGNPFGAVLILHGAGQSVDEPDEINAIRNNLSHYGWATLSVNLPPPNTHEIPPRPTLAPKVEAETTSTETVEGASAKESEAVKSEANNTPANKNKPRDKNNAPKQSADADIQPTQRQPEDLTKARIDAAVAFMKEQGQYNIVVVGHGMGAARAMRYIDALGSGSKAAKNNVNSRGKIQRQIRALVLVQARNRIPETDDQLTNYFNDAGLPILDIYYGDHYLDSIETEARAKAARAARIENYYNIKILRPTKTDENSENRLTRRVRGFLNKHAKGVEIERNR